MVRAVAVLLMRTDEDCEYRGKEHEDEGLDEADQQLHEVKGYGNDDAAEDGGPRGVLDEIAHRLEHVFSGVHVPVETEAERDGAEEDRDHLETSDADEDDDHEDLHETLGVALGREEMHDEAAEAVGLEGPDGPHHKEDNRHGEGHVEIGIGATEEGLGDVINAEERPIGMPKADGADTGDEAKPIREEDEDEDGGEEPEGLLDELMADHALEEIVEALDKPLDEVLRAVRHFLHITGGDLRKADDADGDNPRHHHGTGHRDGPHMEKDGRIERQALLLRLRRACGHGRAGGERQGQEKHY